jgi:hypothetical protein
MGHHLTPGPSRSGPTDSPGLTPGPDSAAPPVKLRTLLASHKGLLGNVKMLCEGQLALVKAHEMGARLGGEAKRDTYVRQMDVLAQQQRLLACQLADSLLPLVAALEPEEGGERSAGER